MSLVPHVPCPHKIIGLTGYLVTSTALSHTCRHTPIIESFSPNDLQIYWLRSNLYLYTIVLLVVPTELMWPLYVFTLASYNGTSVHIVYCRKMVFPGSSWKECGFSTIIFCLLCFGVLIALRWKMYPRDWNCHFCMWSAVSLTKTNLTVCPRFLSVNVYKLLSKHLSLSWISSWHERNLFC